MNQIFTYRQLNYTDSKQYRKLRLLSLQLHPKNFLSKYEEQVKLEEMFMERCLRENDLNNLMFGAFEKDELIGICGFNRGSKDIMMHSGEIIQMFVIPEKSGNKIGFNLLSFSIDKLFQEKGIEQVSLWVNTDIISANKVYEQVGFKQCGYMKNAFKENNEYKDMRLMMIYKM